MTDPAPTTDPIPIDSLRRRAAARRGSGKAEVGGDGGRGGEPVGPASDRAAVVAAARADRAPLDVARRIVEVAEDKKAAEIVLLDLAGLTTMADHFVICSGGSERQIAAIADGVVEALKHEGVRPIGREGDAASHWILVDFGSVIVHVFTPPERDYYDLEKHWSEAKTVLRVQ